MQSPLESLTVRSTGSVPCADELSLLLVAPEDSDLDAIIRTTAHRYPAWRVTRIAPDADWHRRLSAESLDVVLLAQSAIEPNGPCDRADVAQAALADLRERVPKLRIVVFGHNLSDVFVSRMLRLGIHGLVDSGSVDRDRLAEAIEEVCRGGYWLARKALEKLIHSTAETERVIERSFLEQVASMQASLTRREADVLERLLEGLSTRDIAGQLFVSEQGVKLHLGRLFKKFGVSNRSQLILHAFQQVCPFNGRIAHYFRQTRSRG
jgi:DNA-binding NarL/FixJ family response regulator